MAARLIRILPELLLTAGIFAVLLVDLIGKKDAPRRKILAAVALAALASAAVSLAFLPSGDITIWSGMIAFDGFALFFKGLFLVAAAFGVLLGAASDEIAEKRYGEYLLLLFCLTLGLNFLASAHNLLMIYLSIELVSIPSYVLAGFRRGDRRSSEAALKYVIYGAAASGMMLYGFSLIYGITGTLDLARIGRVMHTLHSGGPAAHLTIALAAIFSLAGFCYKVAAVPFHMWCPDVYEGAPTPFVAFLSVGPKAAGFAALARFFLVGYGSASPLISAGQLPWPVIIGVLAVATMTLGNLSAIGQTNVKRLLAYSSIAHAGYMLMGVAVGTPDALRAVMLYLGIYLAMNLGAFTAVMAVRALTGSEQIPDYKGLGGRSPYLAAVLAIFLFSLTGLPPFGGFIAKFYLFASVLRVESPFFYVVALIGVLNSVVSLYYYARILKTMYLESAPGEASALPMAPSHAVLATVLAIPTLLLGVWWTPLIEAINRSSSLLH